MSPFLSLRIAAVVSALLCAGHTAGMPWTPDPTPRGAEIVAAMQGYHFDVMGFTRGYWDFYVGFGLSVSVGLAALSVLLWQLAGLSRQSPEAVRPMIATMLLAFIGFTVLDVMYFFTAPLVLNVPIVACLAWAWLRVKAS